MTNKQIAQLLSIVLAIAGILIYIHGDHMATVYSIQAAAYQSFGMKSIEYNPYEFLKLLGIAVAVTGGITYIGFVNQEISDDN